jgi:hypothetical protein
MSSEVVRFVAIAAATLAAVACSGKSGGDPGPMPQGNSGAMPDSNSSQKASIGSPCTKDSDCGGTGFLCMTDHPGGYCVETCDMKNHDADCPSGSACQFDGITSECHKACANDSDCRTGYVCAPASMTPTNTVSHAVCELP